MFLEGVQEFKKRYGIQVKDEQVLLLCVKLLFGDISGVHLENPFEAKMAFFLSEFSKEDLTKLAYEIHTKLMRS